MLDLICDLVLISFPDHLVEPSESVNDVVAAPSPSSLLLHGHTDHSIDTHVEIVSAEYFVVNLFSFCIIDITIYNTLPER